MEYAEQEARIKDIILPLLERDGLILVELHFIKIRHAAIVRLLVDRKEGGINLEECSRVNREVGTMLDESDVLQERYTLEVSSPGLDRPLREKNDFLRTRGRKAKFFLNEAINGKIEIDGVIKEVHDDSVIIEYKEATLEIPLIKISKAKQIIK